MTQTSPAFDLTNLLGYRMARLSALIGQSADKDAHMIAGISLAEYRVLVVLASMGPQGVAGLQEAMQIDKAWISRTMAKLIHKGMAVSVDDLSDARRILFSLSKKGRLTAKALIQKAAQRQMLILKGISEDDQRHFAQLLSQIQNNVDALVKAS